MRNFKKRTIALCLASAVTVLGSFAADMYRNSLMSLRIDSGSDGYVSFTAFTKKPFEQTVRTEQIDSNTYYVILPGTKSEVTSMPMINGFNNIDSMQISTFPYAAGVEGYTRITVKTKGEPQVTAATSLYIEAKPSPAQDNLVVHNTQQTEKKEKVQQSAPVKQTSYWDQHVSANKPEEKQQSNIPQKTKTAPETSFKQKNTQSADFNSNYQDMPVSTSGEKLPILIGAFVLAMLVVFIIFIKKDQMAAIVGNQNDFNFDDDEEKKKSKSKVKKIKNTINNLDNKFKNIQNSAKVNIVTGAAIKEEPVVEKTFEDEPQETVVDLDSLYNEKNRADKAEVDVQVEQSGEEVDDLAELMSQFMFEEEKPQAEQESFDEELYNSTINNNNLNFSKNDSNKINQLLQNEIGDETLNNIEEFANKEHTAKHVPTEIEILENVIAEYTIKQDISFSKDDVDTLRKLINVELDDSFITDLRTNPQRTEAMRQELENKEKKPHKTSEMLILNVKDLLPDLSKEMKKQGNKKIESNAKPDVIYYSEGYEVSKLSVSGDLANVSAAVKKESNNFRPSDDLPVAESGYDFQTLSIKDSLPNIADYKKNPKKYENKKSTEKVDEKALLLSIENVQFKPFYDNVQEELNNFDGFEVVDNEAEERKVEEAALQEIERYNKEQVKRAKPEQTEKVKNDAQRLLELISEQQAERELRKMAANKSEAENAQNSLEKEEAAFDMPKTCDVEGVSYNVIKCAKNDNISCYLAKNENGYFVIGNQNGNCKILKQYDELSSENIQTRVNETNPDGSIQYLIRVGVHKFIVNVTNNSMEFLMDLC